MTAIAPSTVAMLSLGLATSRLMKLKPADATTVLTESGVQNGTLGIAVGSLIALSNRYLASHYRPVCGL